jgi:hypothetical protein
MDNHLAKEALRSTMEKLENRFAGQAAGLEERLQFEQGN